VRLPGLAVTAGYTQEKRPPDQYPADVSVAARFRFAARFLFGARFAVSHGVCGVRDLLPWRSLPLGRLRRVRSSFTRQA